ncbi:MAG: Gfo/Idh/MocA family oxidoreductase [Planctomycetes bacterium]|nr:Gfo/Idh/MocA family oxidoreductase [Planctomycetota bacterium]
MNKLTTALIGCGSRGMGGHLKVLEGAEDLELIAVCDIIEDRAKAAAEQFADGKVEVCTDYVEMMKRDDLDTVIISTHAATHAEIALEAIRRGKHFIVEKPLSTSIPDGRKLAEAAEKAKIKAMVCYQIRFMRFCEEMKDVCREIDPVQILLSHPRGMMKPQFLNPDPFCGIHDVISHHIDLASLFMGRDPTAVFSSLRRNSFTDTDAVDNITVCIEYGEGDAARTATLVSSIGAAGIGDLFYVIGSKGLVSRAGGNELVVKRSNDEKPRKVELPAAAGDSTRQLHAHFAQWVRDQDGKVAPRSTLRDGLNSLLISLATFESQKTGKKIKLADFDGMAG